MSSYHSEGLDRAAFQSLLKGAVDRTEGAEVEPLEKLYAVLAQCIYRHRNDYEDGARSGAATTPRQKESNRDKTE